jgi:7,8-dihydroneopterin aldolase/epimerase/oxygenase
MQEVALLGVEFFAYHGFYEEERRIGNKFIADIKIQTDFTSSIEDDDLAKTVDYEQLYAILRAEMDVPSKLLEHVAGRILDKVCSFFPFIRKIEISIAKQNPPIGGICRESRITLVKEIK